MNGRLWEANKICRGFFGHGEMQKEFEDAAFALQPGQVSGIVDSASGVHLIQRYVPSCSGIGSIKQKSIHTDQVKFIKPRIDLLELHVSSFNRAITEQLCSLSFAIGNCQLPLILADIHEPLMGDGGIV